MAAEIVYGGVISSDLRNKQTADGVLITSLYSEVQNLIALYNRRRQLVVDFMGFLTTKPDADRVLQASAKWMRYSEHGKADQRTKLSYDIAVSTGLEGFSAYLGISRLAELLAMDASTMRGLVSAVIEANAKFRYESLFRQFYNNAPRTVVDVITKLAVTVNPFYYGTGDTEVPPPVGNKTFSAGHNHFVRSATTAVITSADLDALVRNVTEHGFTSQVFIGGSDATVDQIMALGAPDVAPFVARNTFAPNDAVNINQPGVLMQIQIGINDLFKAVGVFKGKATIVVIDGAPDGYVVCFSHEGNASSANPLQVREPNIPALRGIHMESDNPYPFVESYFNDFFGVGVRQRGNGAVMQYVYTGANTDPYTPPVWAADPF